MPNNRQFATLIWLGIIAGALLLYPKTRSCIKDLASTAASPTLMIPVVASLAYVLSAVFVGWRLNWWRINLATDTAFWFVGSALVLLFNIERAWKEESFFRRTALGAVGMGAAISFFVNDIFVFSLWVELALSLLLTVLAVSSVVAESDSVHAQFKRVLDGLMAWIGIALVIYLMTRIISDWRHIDAGDTLRAFAMPIWLSLTILPFIFFVSLYAVYERAFIWIDFKPTHESAHWRAKVALVLRLNLRLRHVAALTGYWGRELGEKSSLRAAWRMVGEFVDSITESRRLKASEQDRLQHYAGVDGVDDHGRRLDRREFKETKAALQQLASAQMGWYRNRGDVYRPELLDILAPRFEREGLPADHGITFHVTDDGQMWWAWRRTSSGWCFGIGAMAPPPDEWLYEGPEPPQRGPAEGGLWSRWGAGAENW